MNGNMVYCRLLMIYFNYHIQKYLKMLLMDDGIKKNVFLGQIPITYL